MVSSGRLVCLALALLLLGQTPAIACSLVPGTVRPSNFELVQDADAIVVATPTSERGATGDGFKNVTFRTVRTIKGEVAATFEVGRLGLGRARPSDPNQIMFSHPEGHMGPCNRVTLARDKPYVLFLSHDRSGKLEVYGAAFSRVSEDYAGPDSIWMRTIGTYLDLQQRLDPMAQLDALITLRATLPARPVGTTFQDLLANDIDMHLASISPWKPTGFLLAALSDHRAGRPPRYGPRPTKFDKEQSAAEAFTEALFPQAAKGDAQEDYNEKILTALAASGHPDAWPVFEPLVGPNALPADLSLGLRYLVNHDRYPEAYALIEARGPTIMATATEAQAAILADAISDVQEDPAYDETTARWRNDPAVAARWPTLALRLHKIEAERFGWDDHYRDALLTIIAGDWRAYPELTYSLSGHYDQISEWAVDELEAVTRQAPASPPAGPGRLTLPLAITVRWLGHKDEEEFALLSRIFCSGADGRATVLRAWGANGDFMGLDRFTELAASPTMTAEDWTLLATAAQDYEARRRHENEGELYEAETKWIDLFKLGQPLTVKDLGKIRRVGCTH